MPERKTLILPLLLLLFTVAGAAFSGCTDDPVGPELTDNSDGIPDAYIQNKKLGRGINLGNALEAPREGDWGVILKDEYFRLIKQKGFNSVRIPVKWSAHSSALPPYLIDTAFFNRVDWAVNHALTEGLAVIINIHHYYELMDDPAANRSGFLALWKNIAEHYKNYSDNLFFELLNEPNNRLTLSLWNQYLNEAINTIRQTNPYRTILTGPADYNSIFSLNLLSLPQNDRNIIVSFHYYNPFIFTHQGAEWVSGSQAWLGTKWLGSQQEMNNIAKDLDIALAWSKTYNRPINLGEFGAYGKADLESRVRWTGFVTRQAELRGFSWNYWEFCAGFGIYDPAQNKWNTPLLNSLIPPDIPL